MEKAVELTTTDGTVDGFVYTDDDRKALPGVILLTDIRGIRDANRGMAARLAADGYTVLMPNVFYRSGRPPIMDPNAEGDALMKRFGELRAPLTPEALDNDAAAYVDYLGQLETTSNGPMGVVGYCFTGGMALRMAAVRPDTIAAAASFHGGGLYTEDPASPHLVLPSVKARLYFGHAFQDRSMPAEAIGKLEKALAEWGGQFESTVYSDAGHGWTVPDSKAYHEAPAEEAYRNLTELFAATLKSKE